MKELSSASIRVAVPKKYLFEMRQKKIMVLSTSRASFSGKKNQVLQSVVEK